jgi:Transposase DDE domain
MEHQLFKAIVALVCSLDNPVTPARFDFSDQDIVLVYYWSVICDRPTSWACQRRHWPLHQRKRPLPTPATMSRRLRSPSIVALLDRLEQRVTAPKEPGLYWMLDGKPLVIGGASKDRQAGYGVAAGTTKAKGYKLHALVGADGSLAQWRVAPMNKDERVMAERMLRAAPAEMHGYIAADANYDSNRLHDVCDQHGNLQLVTPRRYGPRKGTGHRQQTAGRLRSIAITENPYPAFGKRLLKDRNTIERTYGNLTNWSCGLNGLPSWVRTHRRVRRWVQAKLVLVAVKQQIEIRTCAA